LHDVHDEDLMRDAPSRTARKVALNVLMLGAEPRMADILPAGSAQATEQLLLAAGVTGAPALRFAKTPTAWKIAASFDWMMPGQLEGFAHRKRFCEDQVRAAVAEGATQVLVLGAGYDTLGWRLAPDHADVGFYEIDHPATSRAKARGIAALGSRPNLHLIAEDLSQRRLSDVLAKTRGWDVSAASVVVAEGLLMYLPERAVRELFEMLAESTGPNSRVAFSHVSAAVGGRPEMGAWPRLMDWSLRLIGEPWLWGHPPDSLDAFLRPLGWKLEVAPTRAGIEWLAVARRS
jgi:methyltransferase (TIGR00027 family)